MNMNHSADVTRISARKRNTLPRWQEGSKKRVLSSGATECERGKSSVFKRKSKTLAFYEKNARLFCASTQRRNLRTLYAPFFKELPLTAHILDAGCGSGRDTKAFLAKGFSVTAIDASPRIAQLATKFTGQLCQAISFQKLNFHHEFDGIWACASLLHIPQTEMPIVLRRFANALKRNGVLYVSLKEGHGEYVAEDGRLFNCYDSKGFAALLTGEGLFKEIHAWKTHTPDSSGKMATWLNFLARKSV